MNIRAELGVHLSIKRHRRYPAKSGYTYINLLIYPRVRLSTSANLHLNSIHTVNLTYLAYSTKN